MYVLSLFYYIHTLVQPTLSQKFDQIKYLRSTYDLRKQEIEFLTHSYSFNVFWHDFRYQRNNTMRFFPEVKENLEIKV